MKPKVFWGKDMSEALRAVRSSLGADALISETRNLSKDLGGGVEITALESDEIPAQVGPLEIAVRTKPQNDAVADLREELTLLKSMLGWLAPGLGRQDKLIRSLVTHGVTPENISKLLHAMESAPQGCPEQRWEHAIAGLLPALNEISPSGARLAVVGPSGAGKSATLIKLTLAHSRQHASRAGWISMDDRLNCADALVAYAGILGVRFERAASRAELKIALERLADCDLILIDTPGLNPRSAEAIAHLAKAFHGLEDLRCLLVLSAITNGADLIDWVDSYRVLPLHSLLFTKLDECRYLGPLFNTALSAALPLSYITYGQSLTEDLAVAKPEVFASLLLTGVADD